MNRTASIFDRFAERDAWLGFGYIGGRRNALDSSDPESPAQPELVAAIDALVLEHAASWTDEELFVWANSTSGRHFADAVFGGTGTAAERFAQALRWNLLHKVADR